MPDPNDKSGKTDTNKPLRQRLSDLTHAVRASSAAVNTHRIQTKISTWVVITCSVLGGFVALQTYRLDVSKDIDESVAKSFEMIMYYNGEEMAGVRRNVRSYVNARRICDSRLISRELEDADFHRIIDFFDLVQACVDADLCDADAAAASLSRQANFDWPILTTVVDQMKDTSDAIKADAGFARGYAAFATNPVEAPPCDGNF